MRFGVQGYIYSYLVRPFYLLGPALLELSRSLYGTLPRGAAGLGILWTSVDGLAVYGFSNCRKFRRVQLSKALRLRLSRPTVVRVNAPEKKTAKAILVDPAM